MTKLIILTTVFFFFTILIGYTQMSNSSSDADTIKRMVLSKGKDDFQCDLNDIACNHMQMSANRAYEELKKNDVEIIKTYCITLKKAIESYTFADSVSTYFDIDPSYFEVDFYVSNDLKKRTIGSSTMTGNSDEFSSIYESSTNGLTDMLINSEYHDFFWAFPFFLDCPMFVHTNRLYVISEGKIIEGSKFFKKFSFKEITLAITPISKSRVDR